MAISANVDAASLFEPFALQAFESYQAGGGSLQEAAKQNRVSWGYSKKIRAQQLRTGRKSGRRRPSMVRPAG